MVKKGMISKLGEYQEYSEEKYDGYTRKSQYITVRDGTKLASDIYLPTSNGALPNKTLPLICSHTRYQRAQYNENGEINLRVESPLLKRLLKNGYILAIVDMRGSGASYGSRRGEFLPEEAQDGYDIIEWFARQPWCNGNIGMFGLSYMGGTQYLAAGMTPPHLKAIIPEMAPFDLYPFVYPGGVYKEEFVTTWGKRNILLDKQKKPVPVDEDHDASVASKAVLEHENNVILHENVPEVPYRDSKLEDEQPFLDWSPNKYIEGINESGIAVYHISGWYDLYPRGQLAWFKNLKGPQRLLMAPWSHTTGWLHKSGWEEMVIPLLGYEPSYDEILEFHFAEMLRWYDYWLKGIDNGIMNEPPIHYYTMGEPKDKAWKTSNQWPLQNETRELYYLHEHKLKHDQPKENQSQDDYKVDTSTTTGTATRWRNGYGGPFRYPDMSENDSKALSYTTAPLEHAVEVTGHPVLHLWVTVQDDVDFFAYLEEVDQNGYSHYLTEGSLRTSHRKLHQPPYNYMDLPYHRSYKEDMLPILNEPVELVFDLLPISNIFDVGNRIRLAITCADKDNYEVKELSNQDIIVHRNKQYPSYISLPIIS